MNIKKLQQYIKENGNEFKSYRHLCKVLDVKPKGGDSKNAHIKKIKRFCNLSAVEKSYKLIVNEIYDTPKPEEGNNIYGGLVQLLLTDYFMKTKKSNIVHSSSYLMQQVNMINENYRRNKRNIQEHSERINVDKGITHDFYDTTDSTLKSAIETALKNLENKALILYTTEYIVKPEESKKYRVASTRERSVILSTRDKLLKELGYKTIREVLFSKDQKLYKSRTNAILKEKINVDYVFKGYSIDILQDNIAQKQAEMIVTHLTDNESQNHKDELNNLVINRLLNNAIKRHKDIKKLEESNKIEPAFGEGEISRIKLNRKQEARKSDEYINSIGKLVSQNIDNKFYEGEIRELQNNKEIINTIDGVFSQW